LEELIPGNGSSGEAPFGISCFPVKLLLENGGSGKAPSRISCFREGASSGEQIIQGSTFQEKLLPWKSFFL